MRLHAWLQALCAPLNTKAIGLAGIAIASSGGTLIGTSVAAIVGLVTDPEWLLLMFSLARHTPSPNASLAAARLTGAIFGVALGMIGGAIGLFLAWIGYTPFPPSPPSAAGADPSAPKP